MRWEEHVACLERREMHTVFWWGNLEKRKHFHDPDAKGRTILRCVLNRMEERGMD